jgi:hypothetical protein
MWLDGTFNDGYFRNGVWLDGTFNGGYMGYEKYQLTVSERNISLSQINKPAIISYNS